MLATQDGECRYLVGTDSASGLTPTPVLCIEPASLPPETYLFTCTGIPFCSPVRRARSISSLSYSVALSAIESAPPLPTSATRRAGSTSGRSAIAVLSSTIAISGQILFAADFAPESPISSRTVKQKYRSRSPSGRSLYTLSITSISAAHPILSSSALPFIYSLFSPKR